MTESQLILTIEAAIPKDAPSADRNALAKAVLDKAIRRLGRMPDATFNRTLERITLTANKGSYRLGTELLSGNPRPWQVSDMYRTDTPGWICRMIPFDQFKPWDGGSTDTGCPVKATLHSKTHTLEVWPTPDAAYVFEVSVRWEVDRLQDIPDAYHDVLSDIGITLVQAAYNPAIAIELAKEGISAVANESLVAFTGTVIGMDRHLFRQDDRLRADSGNLTGA